MMRGPLGLILGLWMALIWIPLLGYVALLAVVFSVMRLYECIAMSIAHALSHAKRDY